MSLYAYIQQKERLLDYFQQTSLHDEEVEADLLAFLGQHAAQEHTELSSSLTSRRRRKLRLQPQELVKNTILEFCCVKVPDINEFVVSLSRKNRSEENRRRPKKKRRTEENTTNPVEGVPNEYQNYF
jgi:hypothetical protein